MTQRRIVLGLQAGTARRELEAAAALAGRVGAELMGLFMEDPGLLRFAALPFASEIGFASAARRKPGVEAMARSMQALAGETRRLLAIAAAQSAIPWSFRVERGLATEVLLAAALESLSGAAGGEIRLLLLGDGESTAARWAERASGGRAGADRASRVRVVHAADLAELEQALRGALPGVVVLRCDQALRPEADLHLLLRACDAPVLILPEPR